MQKLFRQALLCATASLMSSFALVELRADAPASFSAAPLPLSLTSFGATKSGDTVFVYGGHTGDAHSYSDLEQSNQLLSLDLKNPQQEWKVCSESTRLQGLALVAYNNKIIRVGGFSAQNKAGEDHNLQSTNEVAAFDIESKQWETLPSLPEPRSSHDALLLGSKLYVVGGWHLNGDSNSGQWHDTAYYMDLASDSLSWTKIATPPFQRRALSLVNAGDSIVAIGGMETKGKITKQTAVYSTTEDAWTQGPELVGDHRMLGFGTAAINVHDVVLLSSPDGALQKLDTTSHTWQPCGKTQDARFFHELVSLDDGHVLVLGGANMEHGKYVDVEVIDVSKL
jgi:hypothetical protein